MRALLGMMAMTALLQMMGCGSIEQRTQLVEPENQSPPLVGYRTSFTVNVNLVAPPNDIVMACVRQGSTMALPVTSADGKTRKLGGCSQWDETTQTLRMWVVPPRYLEDYEHFSRIGHELWHGVMEDYHGPWSRSQHQLADHEQSSPARSVAVHSSPEPYDADQ